MISAAEQISGVAVTDVEAPFSDGCSLSASPAVGTLTVRGDVGRGSSTFLLTGREYAYVQEAGVTRDNFTLTTSFNGEKRYMWTHPALVDAEKDSFTIANCFMYINSCWACTASNMFVRGGWSDGVFASEDEAISYFLDSFTTPDFYTIKGTPRRYYSMSTGCTEFGVEWLLGGKYDFWSDYKKNGWSIPQSSSSGGFYRDTAGGESMKDYLSATDMVLNQDGSKVFRTYVQTTGRFKPNPTVSTSPMMLDEAFGLLQKGYSVGVSIGWYTNDMKKRKGGHAITVCGFSYDESRNGTPGVYTGIFVADSDDDYGNINKLTDFTAEQAPNRVKYLPIEYNSDKGIYVCSDYGTNGVVNGFQYLAPRPADADVSVAADIGFIRNDKWNASYSVGGSAADALSGDRAERLNAAGSVFMALNLISAGPGSIDSIDVTVTIDGDTAGARSYSIERNIGDETVAVVVDLGRLDGGVHELAVQVSSGENADSLAVTKLYVADANNVVREFSVASDIYSDGMELASGDLLDVLAGEVANNCTVTAASEQSVKTNGLSVGSTIRAEGVLTVDADGAVRNSEVFAAGVLFVHGKAEDSVVHESGVLFADRNSLVTGTTVEDGGLMDINHRGAAADTRVGGDLFVANGRAVNTVVYAGGTISVYGTGVAEGTVVQDGGKQHLRSGGLATDNTLTGSACEQRIDGIGSLASGNRLDAAFQIVTGGGVALNNTLANGAVQDLSDGAAACDTELSDGSVQYICGASACDTVIGADCRSLVFEGGVSVAGVVKAGGSLVAGDPDGASGRGAGAVRDLTVEYGGTAEFADGAKLFGTTTVAGRITVSGSVVGASAGIEDSEPSLIFDLSGRSAADEFAINDLGRCSELYFGITLADTQKLGCYKLSAAGAADFDDSITVYAADGEYCGEIDGDEFVVLNDRLISLESSGDALYVSVASSPYAPWEMPAAFIESSGSSASWKHIRGGGGYLLQFSSDGFETLITVRTDAEALSANNLPADLRWRIRPVNSEVWTDGGTLLANADPGESAIDMDKNWDLDLMFAVGDSRWTDGYCARHLGVADEWSGTGEIVRLEGKKRIVDLFSASSDANVLFLSDDAGGDALFVDDIYTALPEGVTEQRARIAKIDEIRAGAGDDVIDVTSRRFDYLGGGLTARGGSGDDVIWANRGDNMLFGDAGDDRLVGASGNDVLAGGSGNDRMHGGGGNDIFAFGDSWGCDTVEQLAGGTVTLWFADGDPGKWNADTLTYIDGENSVSVSGVVADKVALKFGDDGSDEYTTLAGAGAFADFTSESIFEKRGTLAGV